MKECEILGFKAYDEKDENKKLTGKKMFRIVVCVEPNDDNYVGKTPVIAFLDYSEELERNLLNYFENKDTKKAFYETTDNILTGKTKICNIYID